MNSLKLTDLIYQELIRDNDRDTIDQGLRDMDMLHIPERYNKATRIQRWLKGGALQNAIKWRTMTELQRVGRRRGYNIQPIENNVSELTRFIRDPSYDFYTIDVPYTSSVFPRLYRHFKSIHEAYPYYYYDRLPLIGFTIGLTPDVIGGPRPVNVIVNYDGDQYEHVQFRDLEESNLDILMPEIRQSIEPLVLEYYHSLDDDSDSE